jgi:hypothetical protein
MRRMIEFLVDAGGGHGHRHGSDRRRCAGPSVVGPPRGHARVKGLRLGRDGPVAREGIDPRSGRQGQVRGVHAGGLGALGTAVPGSVREAMIQSAA